MPQRLECACFFCLVTCCPRLAADIDLSLEGDARQVSRQQALIRRDLRGAWWLENVGKGTVYVNGSLVNKLASCELSRSVDVCVCVRLAAFFTGLLMLCCYACGTSPSGRLPSGPLHRRQAYCAHGCAPVVSEQQGAACHRRDTAHIRQGLLTLPRRGKSEHCGSAFQEKPRCNSATTESHH